MQKLTTASEVIDKLGGDEAAAALFGVKKSAVWMWRNAKKFPPKLYLAMKVELAKQDCEADIALWNFKQVEAAE